MPSNDRYTVRLAPQEENSQIRQGAEITSFLLHLHPSAPLRLEGPLRFPWRKVSQAIPLLETQLSLYLLLLSAMEVCTMPISCHPSI